MNLWSHSREEQESLCTSCLVIIDSISLTSLGVSSMRQAWKCNSIPAFLSSFSSVYLWSGRREEQESLCPSCPSLYLALSHSPSGHLLHSLPVFISSLPSSPFLLHHSLCLMTLLLSLILNVYYLLLYQWPGGGGVSVACCVYWSQAQLLQEASIVLEVHCRSLKKQMFYSFYLLCLCSILIPSVWDQYTSILSLLPSVCSEVIFQLLHLTQNMCILD